MHTHEIRKRETAFGCTDEEWTPLLKVCDMLARKVVVGEKTAAIRIARERLSIEQLKQSGLTDLHTKRIGEFQEQIDPGVEVRGTVVAMDHGHRQACGRRHHV